MKAAGIRGVGLVGSFGCGTGALENSLRKGPKPPEDLVFFVSGRERRIPVHAVDTSPLDNFVSKREIRRIDHFSRMALLGAFLALEDSGLTDASRDSLGLIIATGYGAIRTTFAFLDSVLVDGDSFASPTLFSNSVHNAAAAHVAIQLKITGPSLTVSQFEMSVSSALLTALRWLDQGRVERVLFGGVDEVCSVIGYCHERFFGDSGGRIQPFAANRHTAVAGEGAAFFLLDRQEESRYGLITEVRQGRITKAVPFPEKGSYIINADGHPGCFSLYRQLFRPEAEVAAFANHYGSFPSGQSFDLAIAALALRNGIFPSISGQEEMPKGWRYPGVVGKKGITCLKCDGEGYLGAIGLKGG
ncbi:MAG: beta-ketoacyl synthase [Desulfuromonadaceae bacterium]|nr:beta-ketoacyl synthase [Desulfuromonadaceae bacterium]